MATGARIQVIRRERGVAGRDRRRRRYAAVVGVIALVLLVVGAWLGRRSGAAHALGVVALGYGIGSAVAAVLPALGREPRRRKS